MRLIRRLLVGLVALVLLFIGALALAAYLVDIQALIDKHKPQALAAASEALNREVDVSALSPTWFPILGLRAEHIRVGDEPLVRTASASPATEDRPDFVDLGAVQVGVAIWPALTSLGRTIEVTEIRLEKPEIRLIRFQDGSFNFSTLGPPSKEGSEPEPKPEPKPEPEDEGASGGGFADRLKSASVQRIRIVDARVRYEDRMAGGLGTIEAERIDFSADNVGLGLPIEAALKVALKDGEEPNLEVVLRTAALAKKVSELGMPEIRSVELKANEFPLSLVPVDAQGVVLDQAGLSADLRAEAGENGALNITGPLSVNQLRLSQAGASPGAAFDVVLGLAARTSTRFEKVTLNQAKVAVGALDTRVSGQVRLTPAIRWDEVTLDTPAPFSVQQFAAIAPGERLPVPGGGLSLDLDTSGNLNAATAKLTARYVGLSYAQEALTAAGDAVLTVAVDGPLATPRVDLRLDLEGVDVKGQGFKKPKGTAAQAQTTVGLKKDAVEVERFEVRLAEAVLSGKGRYPLAPSGQVDFSLGLGKVALKPFLSELGIAAETLPKGSELAMDLRYRAPAATPGNGALTVPNLSFVAGESRLSAKANVERFSPLVLRIEGSSPRLNLDTLLPASSAEPAGPADPKPSEPADTPSGGEEEPLLPASMREARMVAELEVRRLRYQGVELSSVEVLLELADGTLTVKTTEFGLFGGRFSANGTKVNLTSAPLQYDLRAGISRVQAESLLANFTEFGQSLTGLLNSQLKISGQGLAVEDIARSLTGSFSMGLKEGRLDGVNLAAATILPLQEKIDLPGVVSRLNLGDELETQFKTLQGQFEVKDGRLALTSPMTMDTQQGKISFKGGMTLDGNLGLDGALEISPSVVRKMTGGKVRLRKPLPVNFTLGCSLTKPCVKNVNVDKAAEALAKQLGGRLLDKAAGSIGAPKISDALRDAEAAKRKAEAEARKKAEEAAARAKAEAEAKAREAEAEAKRAAAKAKADAEREAKEAAEKARKKAEEEGKNKLKGLFGR